MPAVQTTYTERQPIAVAGMPATMETWDGDTGIVETVAGIEFARAVAQGTNDNGIITAGATNFTGVTYRDITLIHANPSFYGYIQGESAGVMTRGDIWVDVFEAVTTKDPVGYNSGGRFGKSGTVLTNARWVRGIGAPGGLALLRLNKP